MVSASESVSIMKNPKVVASCSSGSSILDSGESNLKAGCVLEFPNSYTS